MIYIYIYIHNASPLEQVILSQANRTAAPKSAELEADLEFMIKVCPPLGR